MPTILLKIIEHKETLITLGILIFLLTISGNVTSTIKGVKKGLAEAVTPLGFFIFLAILYFAYQFYLKIAGTL